MTIRIVTACVAALVAASAAGAQSGVRISGVDASEYPTVRFSVVTPAPSAKPPAVRENDERVAAFHAENLGRAKSVVLAVDRSQSMEGMALVDASNAARAFVGAKPEADRISVVAFGATAVQLTSFSTATIDADSALTELTLDEQSGTALYDAVVTGSRALATEVLPARVLIVLTDGRDVSSEETLATAIAEARKAGAIVYPIGIESRDFSAAPLERLARATGGTYYSAATTSALAEIYASIAEEFRRTWRVSYVTAARRGESVRVEAAVPGAGVGTSELTLPGEGVAQAPADPSPMLPGFVYENGIGMGVLALVVGFLALTAALFALSAPAASRLRRRIDPHVAASTSNAAKQGPKERFGTASTLMTATEKTLSHLRMWKKLHALLERADLPLRTVEFVYIAAGAGLLLGLVVAVTGASSVAILFAMAAGAGTPVLVVVIKARRRLAAIENQLPDLLITIAASLKAGHSFRQGLQAVVDEGQPPASDEFKRVLAETSLGRPMDAALAEMVERVGSKNLAFVITAVTIQRQVGGSLAGIFDMVAEAVRNRQQFARKIKSLTAMGRMSAYVLIGLPFFIAGAITLLNADYMYPLYHTSAGHKLMILGLVMMAFGTLILKKIVAFKG